MRYIVVRYDRSRGPTDATLKPTQFESGEAAAGAITVLSAISILAIFLVLYQGTFD